MRDDLLEILELFGNFVDFHAKFYYLILGECYFLLYDGLYWVYHVDLLSRRTATYTKFLPDLSKRSYATTNQFIFFKKLF